MPFEFLSDEQVARYGRFPQEPSVAELEQFFRLDQVALERVAIRRRPAMKLGWAVQWGTVRMLGVFLTENPTAVPDGVVAFVAEQLDVDAACFADYGRRPQTVYQHAWEIRELLGYRDFSDAEAEVRRFLAARVWSSTEGPRALFDRARVFPLKERVGLGHRSRLRDHASQRGEFGRPHGAGPTEALRARQHPPPSAPGTRGTARARQIKFGESA
ncbi:DUF4158 domain-containing protein [Sphaerisporangium sp. NPDC051011]|uniref:DUF4158 domain-containing protein n=1 Tax=Sphaerisporangium sp. NPDC051011 TaxID=3155792 RepID=UPI0033C8A85E